MKEASRKIIQTLTDQRTDNCLEKVRDAVPYEGDYGR